MTNKIIDADKFVLQEIFWPFQQHLGVEQKHLVVEKRFGKQPFNNKRTIEMLKEDTEWSRAVINRISLCNFVCNKWVNHPIINYLYKIKKLTKEDEE